MMNESAGTHRSKVTERKQLGLKGKNPIAPFFWSGYHEQRRSEA